MYSLIIPTPLGPLLATASSKALRSAELLVLAEHHPERPNRLLLRLSSAVEGYFAGQFEPFTQFPLDYGGLPELRVAFYEQVRQIPYGQTRSYAEMGQKVGLSPRASGAAMRHCPFFLVIPAQRVIHADGSIGGFGGREGLKQWLLEFEARYAPAANPKVHRARPLR